MSGPTGLQTRDLQMFTQEPAPTRLCSQQLEPRPNTLEDAGVKREHYARHTLGTRGKKMFSRKERGRKEMEWGKEGRGGRKDGGAKAGGWALISPPLTSTPSPAFTPGRQS